MATALPNLNAGSHVIPSKPNFPFDGKSPLSRLSPRKSRPFVAAARKPEELGGHSHQQEPTVVRIMASRRESIVAAAAAVALLLQTRVGSAEAEEEGNGLWLTGPLPVPAITNKELANKNTGTRSFVTNGIYMANIGPEGSTYRIRQYAFDLMALGDLMGQNAWTYMRRYLCLKSTFMYFDFDKVISAAPADQKQPLTNLANRLFDSFEKLEDAIKSHSDPTIESCYAETTPILQEVMIRMA